MINLKTLTACAALSMAATTAFADTWTLDSGMSSVAFGSIKNDYAGESHSFTGVTGKVGADGMVMLEVALGSVQTNIDVRNERMVEFVFNNAPSATISAEMDMAAMEGLAVGDTTIVEATGTLNLLGEELDVDANLFVMRMSDTRVMVLTDGMAMLSTEDAGIDAGIDKLQELAGLDSITRVSPVTMRLMFDKDM